MREIEIYPDYDWWSRSFLSELDDLGVQFTVHEYDDELNVPMRVELLDSDVEIVLALEAHQDWCLNAYWAADAYRIARWY